MLTTDANRANAVPKPLLVSCLSLLVLRLVLIGWNCFVPPAKISDIVWINQAEAMHFDSTIANNLNGKLKLLYEYNGDGVQLYRLVDATVLNNRAVVNAIKQNFVDTYRLESGEHVEPKLAKLIAKYRVGVGPTFIVTLPDGTVVSSIGIISDRSMVNFFDYCQAYRYWTAAGPYLAAGDNELALAALDKWTKKSRDATSRCNAFIYEWLIKRRLGQPDQANACLQQVLQTPGERYSKHIANYLLGTESEAAMVKEMGDGFANFIVAEKFLLEGDKKQAKSNFEKALNHGSKDNLFYRVSQAELKSMGVDTHAVNSEDGQGSEERY